MGPTTERLDLGGSGTRTKFLGARGRIAREMALEDLIAPTPKPMALDTEKLLRIGLGAFALLVILILLSRRKRA